MHLKSSFYLAVHGSLRGKSQRRSRAKAVKEHIARGGQLGSRETAFFVGLATLAGLVRS